MTSRRRAPRLRAQGARRHYEQNEAFIYWSKMKGFRNPRGDPRRPKGGTQGEPRETQGHPRGNQGDPRGINRAWRLDETAFREKVFFCKSQIGPGVSTKPTTTSKSSWGPLLTLQRNGRKSGKHHFCEVKVRGSRLGGANNNIY